MFLNIIAGAVIFAAGTIVGAALYIAGERKRNNNEK